MVRSTKWHDKAASCRRIGSGFKMHRSIVLLLVALTGCTTVPISFTQPANRRSTSTLTPANAEPLKLGLLFSLSGSLARYGSTMQDTTQMLVETVNGCNGVLGQAVQLLSEDDQSSATVGRTAMRRLAEVERVGAVIGAIGSEVSNAAVDIAVKNQVVQISPASASSVLTERAQKGALQGFWFRTMPPDPVQGEALARLAQKRGFKTVSVLAIDNDYGNSIARSFEATFKQLGGTVSGSSNRYSPYAALYGVDFYTAFSGQPDAVLIVAEPYLGSEILKTAFESGLWSGNTKVLLTASMKTENLASRVGQSIDGRYIASGVVGIAPATSSPVMEAFRDNYKKRFNRAPNLYDPNTWDAAAVTILAAEAAKATSGTAIKGKILEVANPPGLEVSDICRALALVREGKEINYQGVSGPVDFTKSGDVIGSYEVWTIDYTGKIKIDSTIQAGKDPAGK
ncbi:ABC transporter substrate-binding protein [Leptolyngbya sp. NK1-12]|uniref:ABC transporter substrate-binding protein n=1 Tax=Leptolyngbya sp. NK1-12 TaxID=2547451 RepID=A0AA96WGB6_9CYAN|nr:ABC transporter substrate-binding protein [Leptolyngbya sp. NK1-12]WNZ24739.1 ABC transporter substrate-binding protein [Leptolyngbya sp. NK1-12]